MSLIVRGVHRGFSPGMTVKFLAEGELWSVEESGMTDADFAALWRWARDGCKAGCKGRAGQLIQELERDLSNAKVNRFMPWQGED